ncbi:hypothetical protein [Cutibacterium avidum]|uniref:hypothetical protein n=1 Tax=Cutibacterium avidum TaxID=33010 RepID=UPI0002CCDED7|nr:hypothetical protein [Cutibacterium avidum]AGJ77189.1 hypothetical protein PALO_02870 [Cutibacterium avidum 44067]MCO6671949.1 hypothetical protein [Cutibacterium avidum]MDU5023010.1 hypothetical protein [Cutibacterium avidum]PGX68355.1 hypothetical protein B6N39_07845 [Cutibacterium avidum]PGX70521.1 hypothetical protein B6N38_05840 [Cutibacterium avidum]
MSTDEQTPDPMVGDIAGAAGTPDAIEASHTTRKADPAVDPALNREHRVGRGVEWVRPTDLMARTGSRMAGAGIDFQADMARRSRHAATTSTRALALRARRLPPVSAFGRGHADRATTRDAVGIP